MKKLKNLIDNWKLVAKSFFNFLKIEWTFLYTDALQTLPINKNSKFTTKSSSLHFENAGSSRQEMFYKRALKQLWLKSLNFTKIQLFHRYFLVMFGLLKLHGQICILREKNNRPMYERFQIFLSLSKALANICFFKELLNY